MPYTALHTAAKDGDLARIRRVLSTSWLDPVEVNAKTDLGVTALHMAASNGHTECVQELLTRKPDINLQSNSGDTALHLAIAMKHVDVAKLLLDAGAVMLKNNNGESPRDLADEVTQSLLPEEADPGQEEGEEEGESSAAQVQVDAAVDVQEV